MMIQFIDVVLAVYQFPAWRPSDLYNWNPYSGKTVTSYLIDQSEKKVRLFNDEDLSCNGVLCDICDR